MSTMRCCSAWNLPMGTPNCLRVFEYSTVASKTACSAPTASAQRAAVPTSQADDSAGSAPPSGPSKAARGTRTSRNTTSEARWPSRVGYVSSETPPASRGTRKRGSPASSAGLPEVRVQHPRLAARDHEPVAVPRGRDGDPVQIIAGLGLAVRGHRDQLSGGELRQQRLFLVCRTQLAQEHGGENGAGQVGLEQEAAADPVHRQQGLDRAEAKAAVFLRDQEAEQPQLRELRPYLAAEAARGLADGLARLETVLARDERLEGVGELLLLLRQI